MVQNRHEQRAGISRPGPYRSPGRSGTGHDSVRYGMGRVESQAGTGRSGSKKSRDGLKKIRQGIFFIKASNHFFQKL